MADIGLQNSLGIFSFKPVVIAGPCSAESKGQLLQTAKQISELSFEDSFPESPQIFRAGLWKPRTNPGSFQGVGAEGLSWLTEVKAKTGVEVCCEVATPEHLRKALDAGLHIFWVGARTTADPFSVQALADALKEYLSSCPSQEEFLKADNIIILIKNPVNPDVELWAGAVERFRSAGVRNIVLVHRGFSSYTNSTYRNLPLWHIPIEMKRRYPNLLMLCDPSHMGGRRDLIQPICQQAIDLMYDGFMIECHCNPDEALSDKEQQVTPAELGRILKSLKIRHNPSPSLDESLNDRLLQNLAIMRSQIDSLDETLLEILSKRMDVAQQIGDYKLAHNMPVLQSARYTEIVEKIKKDARELGLSEEFAAKLMELIHRESVRVQLDQRTPKD